MLQSCSLEFVIPVYNEESCIDELMRRLFSLRESLASTVDVSFLFVNDGSRDGSLRKLAEFAERNACVKVLGLTRNFGHQAAVTAGLNHASADWVCIIDADLQDTPELAEDMLELAQSQSLDVVYGQRSHRTGESIPKRITASLFYRVLRWMCRFDIPIDTGDFRLLSRRVVIALRNMPEYHRFLRGMVPWTGFRSAPLLYSRQQRHAGKTKYPWRRMIGLATDAILSFSNMPLRFFTIGGLCTLGLGFIGLLYLIVLKIFTDVVVPGLVVLIFTILIIGGVQIVMLGLIGEYLGRVFEQVKSRPLYFVDRAINLDLTAASGSEKTAAQN